MTKIKRNSHKARDRRNKIKSRVRDLRSRIKKNKPSLPWYFRTSESERLKAREQVETFVTEAGKSLELSPETIEREKLYLRWNLLFSPGKLYRVPENG